MIKFLSVFYITGLLLLWNDNLLVEAARKPHIFMVLVDDWGWNDVGYHRKRIPTNDGQEDIEIRTPNIDKLVKSGVELNRHYTYNFCSPSRASLQSGRLPVHVSVIDTDPLSVNPDDPVSGFAGIPRNMTGIAQQLKNVGYKTHMTGKWDAGMATWEHTPMGRGYDTFFGYYHHANDYYDETLTTGSTVHDDLCAKDGLNLVDLWNTTGPAVKSAGTDWEEFLFTDNSIQNIMNHNPEEPLFLFHSFHIVHTPLQVPEEFEKRFDFIENPHRRKYAAMVEYMDYSLGQMVAALQAKGMWEDTLMVVSSDNGGPIYGSPIGPTGKGSAVYGGATNIPLRGGKTSDWEGGIRVNAFASGGFLPENMRGTVLDDYIHIADWYATFAEAAGIKNVKDEAAARANLPPLDSISQYAVLMGETKTGPRNEIHVSKMSLIQGDYKILTGGDQAIFSIHDSKYMPFDCYGHGWGIISFTCSFGRGRDCHKGCLFNIRDDPTEAHQIEDQPDRIASMLSRLEELNKDHFEPNRGKPVSLGCTYATQHYDGFYGPFIDVPSSKLKIPDQLSFLDIPPIEDPLAFYIEKVQRL